METTIPEHLRPLLEFIRGEGDWSHYGPGIRTFPDSVNEREQKILTACLELEQLGLIKRHHEELGLICWRPKPTEKERSDER